MRGTYIVNTRNRILSQNIQMTLDTKHTDLNNNILVIGGSGAGKTYRFVKPQLMQLTGSYIITDPKGELFRDTSEFLRKMGYEIKVLNLLNEDEMLKSSHFNPFRYVKSEVDILKLITNLIKNTTPEGSTTNDPFWEKAEGMGLQALFYYVWQEGVPEKIWEYKTSSGEDDRERILEAIHNPQIPKDRMFHTFLLDESDSVVLVGNPMQNNQIDNLLKQIVDAHHEGGKNDKSGLVE